MPTIQEINELIAKGPEERKNMTPEEVVRAFLRDWDYPLGFLGAAKKWLSEDVKFPGNGKLNASEKAEIDTRFQRYNVITHRPYGRVTVLNMVSEGRTVIFNREELCHERDQKTGAMYGEFLGHMFTIMEVNDDNEICYWHDYFDVSGEYVNPRAFRWPTKEQIRVENDALGFCPPSKETGVGVYDTPSGKLSN